MSAHEDELAALRAQADQAKATMGELASTLAEFRRSLIEEGFAPAEALMLCATWLTALMAGAQGGSS